MSSCGSCSGDCASCGGCTSCGGCANQLELTERELKMLDQLAQIPFLPIARRMDDPAPVYLEEQEYSREEYSLMLQCMEKKGLITLDFDRPLTHFDKSAYKEFPIFGSMALSRRGQLVVELMQMQGVS